MSRTFLRSVFCNKQFVQHLGVSNILLKPLSSCTETLTNLSSLATTVKVEQRETYKLSLGLTPPDLSNGHI